VSVIGGGLAGSECALALAARGVAVTLYEMKPERFSEAHVSAGLAELVCSNSLRSDEPTTAVGLLKEEMRALESAVMRAAQATRVPAGKALAVDREAFSAHVTAEVEGCPGLELVRAEITTLDDPRLAGEDAVVLAAGPLLDGPLAGELMEITGGGLSFYDAIAPIVETDSVDMDVAFWGSRHRPEDKDYLNCPMDEAQYLALVEALKGGRKVAPRGFEKVEHFEGCLPVEVMAERGDLTLAFGPLKPVGLPDPRTGKEAFAVVQLRAENLDKTAMNMVGFQTKLVYGEQQRVFRMIPGMENAEFLRLGSIHRNTYVNAPEVLEELELKGRRGVYLAGQITGVEGYLESAACGLWLGHLLAARLAGRVLPPPPGTTSLGALMNHLREPRKHFQPSNAQFGLMPGIKAPRKKRKDLYAQRGRNDFLAWRERCRSV
jgi:methylenetetrahydrofolate--tRNA-(uracil-5-)-methyltransferase